MPSIMARNAENGRTNRGRRLEKAVRALAVAVALWAGCGESDPAADSPPTPRVVSLGLEATQALLALGLGDHVVASDPASRLLLHSAGFERRVLELAEAKIDDLTGVRPTLILTTRQFEPMPEKPAADGDQAIPRIEVAPHDMDDAHGLYREIAFRAGVPERAERLVRALSAPLVDRAKRHLANARPCVAVVTSLSPLVLAGGHSFETDVLHALGAESATHDDEGWRVATSIDALAAKGADLILVIGAEKGEVDASAVRELDDADALVGHVTLHTDALWLGRRQEIEPELDAWAAWIARARERAPRAGNCAKRPTSAPQ